jgi:alanine racemase
MQFEDKHRTTTSQRERRHLSAERKRARSSPSVMEISRSSVINNLGFLREYIGNEVRISSVIKGNAYGHGIEVFVPLAEECGIDHFAVFDSTEARKAHKACSKRSSIMIMGYINNYDLDWIIRNGIEFYVFEMDRLKKSVEIAAKLGRKAIIHVELETGLNRTGFQPRQLRDLRKFIECKSRHIDFQGLCTHYAGAESIANHVRVKKQMNKFNRLYKGFVNQGLVPKYRHTANSAAAIVYPRTRMDMVRIGIMQYGFWPSKETYIYFFQHNQRKTNPLRRVITWKSRIMELKRVISGEFIGYNTNYIAEDETTIAVIPVGYSQGYSRSLSNLGRVLIKGRTADVIGLVNMNMITVNVSGIPNVKKGDEVVMIGKQGDMEISVASFSEFTSKVNYELLTRLPERIPRVTSD